MNNFWIGVLYTIVTLIITLFVIMVVYVCMIMNMDSGGPINIWKEWRKMKRLRKDKKHEIV